MKLSDFPIPRNKSKRGMHWGASCYPEEGHWQNNLAFCSDMGIGFIKFVDDGGASGLNVYRECWHNHGIIPIVRFYIGTPGQCGPREEDAIKRIADTLGFATYFELCNEPDLPIEWNYNQPKDWLYQAAYAYCDYAPKVLAAGGLPGTFALASGAFGQLRIDEHGNEIPPIKVNFLKLITDRIGTEIFNSGGWVSMHNYHINHPVDYPYDDVNQFGTALTVEEYNAAPPWAWDYRPMADINAQRMNDRNLGDTIWNDDTCFGAWEVFQDQLHELGLYQTPMITSEGGPTLTRGDDGRYCKTYEELMVWLLEQTYRKMAEAPQYFAYCHWLLYNTTGGWGSDCWRWGDEDYTKAIELFKNTPVGAWGEVIDGNAPTPDPDPPPDPDPILEPDLDNDAEGYGVTVVPAAVEPGTKYWKCTRVHHLTQSENNGNHNVYVNVFGEEGPAREVYVRLEWQNGSDRIPLDKPWPAEPMGNAPLWKGQVVSVEVAHELDSDRVENISTAHADEPPGNTLFHHSFLVEWTLTTKAGEIEPEPPPPEPTEPLGEFIRRMAWDRLYQNGVNRNTEAAFQRVAFERVLGAPRTNEFRVTYAGKVYAAQGFDAILWTEEGNWDDIREIEWNAP